MAEVAPPPYETPTNVRVGQSGGLISADFIPNCIKSGGVFSWAEFERFPVVMQRANEWLSKNSTLEIRTCETVEFNTQANGALVNTTLSVYTASGEGATRYVRGLRLWLQPALSSFAETGPPQIGYFNIMPQLQANFFNIEAAERLDTLVNKTNSMLTNQPLSGRILTIETLSLKCESTGPDPDNTAWTERGVGNPHFVQMLRVFYRVGPPAYEMIGIADFVPGVLGDGGLFGRPVLEQFPLVLGKAHHWMLQQSPVTSLLNAQTLFYKQRWTTHMDTLKMTYTDGDLHSYYVRYLRLAYVISNPQHNNGRIPQNLGGSIRLNCKLFVPGMLEPPGCCTVGSYENQLEVRERMSQWMKLTGAKVISVETLPMRIFSGAENTEGFDTMHTWNATVTRTHQDTGVGHHHGGHHGGHHGHGHHGGGTHHTHTHTTEHKAAEHYLMLYRVYIDGVYPEPAGLPQLPSVEDYMRTNAGKCIIL